MSMSLMPQKTQMDHTKPSTSHPPPSHQQVLEDTNKPVLAVSIPALNLEQELSESDLPSSVLDEIEVQNFQSVIRA